MMASPSIAAPQRPRQIQRVPVSNQQLTHISSASSSAARDEAPESGTYIRVVPSCSTTAAQGSHERPAHRVPIVSTNARPLPGQAQAEVHLTSHPPSRQRSDQHHQQHHHITTLSPEMEIKIKETLAGPAWAQQATAGPAVQKMTKWSWTVRVLSLFISLVVIIVEFANMINAHHRAFVIEGIIASIASPFIMIWDGWRLVRSYRKHHAHRASVRHVTIEGTFTAVMVMLIGATILSITAIFKYERWPGRNLASLVVLIVLLLARLLLFTLTAVERWPAGDVNSPAAPPYSATPQIVLQLQCPNCGGNAEAWPVDADHNEETAKKGDSQPQGVAPAYLSPVQHGEEV
ncbi:hypothetical protein GGR56DRAFT_126629 [Xylariaceae sp. FL0804]|nr:hypothetical protein GGR56DRAFT_126629 [Xylariaceae sp. FL0804]